jgi:hypothetical protein
MTALEALRRLLIDIDSVEELYAATAEPRVPIVFLAGWVERLHATFALLEHQERS